MFVVYLLFGDWLKRHKKAILIVCLLLLLAGTCAAILYGLSHGRLPGGNSMLVRWQYWYASVQMYSDHPFTGVGPGNFAQFYPHYKTAAALETVADPHNFLLNILTQYGPIGLVGFVAAVFIPLAKIIFSTPVKTTPDKHTGQSHFFITAAIFCAILGFLLHNCIDFAIFEPGILTTFWAIMACLIALDFHQKGRTPLALKPVAFVRIVAILAGLVLIGVYFNYALIPVTKAGAKTKLAMQEVISAHQLLEKAAEDDRLDPTALNLNGRFYLQQYNETAKKQPALLKQAEQCFLAAIGRDEADYKNYEKLSEVYNSLAETSSGQEKTDWLNKAFDIASSAVERYPGSGRLRIELAKIAEQLGKTALAIEHYQEAIRIEDAYRGQFQIMYPGREIFSRLGEEKYQFSKQRIKELCQ